MSDYTPQGPVFTGTTLKKPDKEKPKQQEPTTYVPPGPVFGLQPGTVESDPQSGLVKAWSFSVLMDYEQCPQRVFLKRVRKIPQPPAPPLERGNAIHKLAEDYVLGEIEHLPNELSHFKKDFPRLRELYQEGVIEVEQNWGYDADWQPTGWFDKDIWARIKCDVVHHESPTCGKIIDHKTGKRFGNEFKHNAQGLTYAIGGFFRYPKLEFIKTEFWYLDGHGTMGKTYTREQALMMVPRLTERATKLTKAQEFPPRPSKANCKFCPYGINKGNGACEYAE